MKAVGAIPYGHVEYDEDIRSADVREFKEETNLGIDLDSVFDVLSNFHDKEHQTVGIWFIGSNPKGILKAGSDTSAAVFFPIDSLPEKMAFPTDIIIDKRLGN